MLMSWLDIDNVEMRNDELRKVEYHIHVNNIANIYYMSRLLGYIIDIHEYIGV